MECYYFGCVEQSGHYLWFETRKIRESQLPKDFPVGPYVLDGRLLPPYLSQIEGEAQLLHLAGWTIITFWDRSVDSRLGSSSSFVIRGKHEFDRAVEAARACYPDIWARFEFEVHEKASVAELP